MFKILIMMITFGTLLLADGPVLQTGQTAEYVYKDDGTYQAGITRSYTRSNEGVVTDAATNLVWQDDYSENNGSIKTADWQGAIDYCNNLELNGSEWRLPTRSELISLIDYAHNNPAIDPEFTQVNTAPEFQSSTLDYYWSSTLYAFSIDYSWRVCFSYGRQRFGDKTKSYYVRCVRAEGIEPSILTRNDETEIVTDSTTGLQWQDDVSAQIITKHMPDGIEYCENQFTLGGYNDWRLPNINELLSIMDDTTINPSMNTSIFKYAKNDILMSSTTLDFYGYGNIWIVDMLTGESTEAYKGQLSFFRCVRGGQFGHLTCPEGKHQKQGERVCIPGTSTPNPGTYLPNCDSGRLAQGTTDDCNESAIPADPPGLFLPPSSCPPGEFRIQGSNCVVNPFCTDVDEDTYFAEEGCGTPVDCNDEDSSINPGISEICNGVDDNCDGQVDEPENLTPPPCSLQQGVCNSSVRQCGGSAGWLACDDEQYGPDYENPEVSCDGLDNDCDAEYDEDLSYSINHGTAVCTDDGFYPNCDMPWSDCDGIIENGCETDGACP